MLRRSLLILAAAGLVSSGCFGPSDRLPGTQLTGAVTPFPADWTFTLAVQEIALEVSGFLGLPHSITIWCATLDDALYIGARDPESKRWPAWADAKPDVRLKINDAIYEVHLAPLEDAATIARLQANYAAKYHLTPPEPGVTPPPTRYWRVEPRS
jgi:hypothetical protein